VEVRTHLVGHSPASSGPSFVLAGPSFVLAGPSFMLAGPSFMCPCSCLCSLTIDLASQLSLMLPGISFVLVDPSLPSLLVLLLAGFNIVSY
jgi:hypothetical protein